MKKKNGISPTGMKLLGAIGALGAAAVLMVSGTLAWFTVSNAPEISKIRVNVGATQNFEIAKATSGKDNPPKEVTEDDSNDETAWSQMITFGDESGEAVEINLPVKVEGGQLKTVKFDETTGRTAGLDDVTQLSDMENGVAYYSYEVKTGEKTEEKKCAAVMGFWLRTNTSGAISCEMGEITADKSDFKPEAMGAAVKIGENGEFVNLEPNGTVEIGNLEASRDGTYCEIIIYLNGDTSDGDKGVVAMDVGGNEAISVDIDKILFKNSNVNTDGQ